MPPEGVREAGVEDGVSAAPRVRQQHHELKSPGEGQDQSALIQRVEVEGVKRQPAHAEHDHYRDDHPGDLPLQPVALEVRRGGSEPLWAQGEQQRRVGGRHDRERQSEAHDEGVGEDAEPPGVRNEVRDAQASIRREVKRHGEDGEKREQPQEGRDDLGAAWRPPTGKPERLGQRHVAVDAHHRQTEDAGELVDAVQHHHRFARDVAEHPVVLEVLGGDEGEADHEEPVGQRQVENVHRRGRRHFVQFQNGDNDEGVPSEPHDANHQVEDGHGDAKTVNIVHKVKMLIHIGVIEVWV